MQVWQLLLGVVAALLVVYLAIGFFERYGTAIGLALWFLVFAITVGVPAIGGLAFIVISVVYNHFGALAIGIGGIAVAFLFGLIWSELLS